MYKRILVCLFFLIHSAECVLKEELYDAISNRSIDKAIELIQHGADTSPFSNGNSAIGRIFQLGDIRLINALFSHNINLDVSLNDIGHPFLYVLEHYRSHPHQKFILEQMIRRGVNPDPARSGISLLRLLLEFPEIYHIIRELPSFDESTFVNYLFSSRIADFVIDYIVQFDTSLDRAFVLYYALLYQRISCARILLKHVDAVMVNSIFNGQTLLSWAIQLHDSQLTTDLLTIGADVNQPNTDGSTPLLRAVMNGDHELASFLIQHGADTHIIREDGSNLLHIAAYGNNAQLIESLIASGVPINARDVNGNTPLHNAASSHVLDVMRVLIRSGAHIDARNNRGETPLFFSMIHWEERSGAAELLIESGAILTCLNHENNTVLDVAISQRLIQYVRLFLSHGLLPTEIEETIQDSILEADVVMLRLLLQRLPHISSNLLQRSYELLVESYSQEDEIDLVDIFYCLLEYGIDPRNFMRILVDTGIASVKPFILAILSQNIPLITSIRDSLISAGDGSEIAEGLRIAIGQNLVPVVHLLLPHIPLDVIIPYYLSLERVVNDRNQNENYRIIREMIIERAAAENYRPILIQAHNRSIQAIMQRILVEHPQYSPEFAYQVVLRMLLQQNPIDIGYNPQTHLELIIADRFETLSSEDDIINSIINNRILMQYIITNWSTLVHGREDFERSFLERIRLRHIRSLVELNVHDEVMHLLEDETLCFLLLRHNYLADLRVFAHNNQNAALMVRFNAIELMLRAQIPSVTPSLSSVASRAAAALGLLTLRFPRSGS